MKFVFFQELCGVKMLVKNFFCCWLCIGFFISGFLFWFLVLFILYVFGIFVVLDEKIQFSGDVLYYELQFVFIVFNIGFFIFNFKCQMFCFFIIRDGFFKLLLWVWFVVVFLFIIRFFFIWLFMFFIGILMVYFDVIIFVFIRQVYGE